MIHIGVLICHIGGDFIEFSEMCQRYAIRVAYYLDRHDGHLNGQTVSLSIQKRFLSLGSYKMSHKNDSTPVNHENNSF